MAVAHRLWSQYAAWQQGIKFPFLFSTLAAKVAFMKSIYRDLWIRIGGSVLAAHYIDSLGRPETIFQQLTSKAYYIDLFFGSLIAFSLWTLVRAIILQLDKRFSWFAYPTLRLILQFCLALIVPVVLCFLLTYMFLKWVWQQNIFESEYLYNELPVVALVILLINFGYFTWWLYHQQQAPPAQATQAPLNGADTGAVNLLPKGRKPGYIEVQKAGRVLLLKTDDLAYAYLKDGYCYLRTHAAENYVTTYALDDLFDLLDEEQFFRANRQMIVNRRACRAYGSIEFGKINLELEPAFKEPVVVSQKKARAFRDWIAVTT